MKAEQHRPEEPAQSKVAVRKPVSRKAGPVIMILCLMLAVMAVLFVPVLVGGAQTASTSSPAVMQLEAVAYTGVQPALDDLGFAPTLPSALPEGTTIAAVRVLDGEVLEIEYRIDRATLVYRTAPGNEDLTGDFTDYAYTAYELVDEDSGIHLSYAGTSEKKLYIAFWAVDGYSYALVASDGIDAEIMRGVAEGLL